MRPGGKTTHILEVAPEAQVVAVDIDEQRLSRVYDNLKRLGMKATVKQGDGRYPSQWCGEQQFDRILLDAPCSATGVIRRHPDIKWLRRDRDIPELAQLQSEILDAIWPHLKSGGTLVYATCSVLPEENSLQIKAFCNVPLMPNFAKQEHQSNRVNKICLVPKRATASFTLS